MNYVEFLVQFEKSKDPVFVKINANDKFIGPEYGFRVVTTCEMWQNGKHLATGKAVLNIHDVYNQTIGSRLAAKRALRELWFSIDRVGTYNGKKSWRLLRVAISNSLRGSDKLSYWAFDDDGILTKEFPRHKPSTIPF